MKFSIDMDVDYSACNEWELAEFLTRLLVPYMKVEVCRVSVIIRRREESDPTHPERP